MNVSGEDESAVKFLLGFNGEEGGIVDPRGIAISGPGGEPQVITNNNLVQQVISSPMSPMDEKSSPAQVVVQLEPSGGLAGAIPLSGTTIGESGTVITQVVSPGGDSIDVAGLKSGEKPRKREPVDPSRCIYACDSCAKAFTTKFNLKRHINMHCSKSREAGVPIQGPPSASQPSRKSKNGKDIDEPEVNNHPTKIRRITPTSIATTTTNIPKVVSKVVTSTTNHHQQQPQLVPTNTTSTSYQLPQPGETVTVQLQVNPNPDGSGTTVSRILTAAPPQLRTVVNKPAGGGGGAATTTTSLPMQPLPESAVQIIQGLGGSATVVSPQGGQPTQRIVRVISAPQVISTQTKGGTMTGATVQLQAIPVTTAASIAGTLALPTQPIPLVQQIGNRAVVIASMPGTGSTPNGTTTTSATTGISNQALPVMAANISSIMPRIAATAINAHKASSTEGNHHHIVSGSNPAAVVRSVVTNQPLLSSSSSTSRIPLNSVSVTTSSISSPQGVLNEQPPADLFDSEDGDALSVATTTETPTPPPSLNGDIPTTVAAVKSVLPLAAESTTLTPMLVSDGPEVANTDKVVVIAQPQLDSSSQPEEDIDDEQVPFTNTANLLPSNRFHGQLTAIPKGWLRKVVTVGKGFQKVFYYNPVGKRFSCQSEIDQHFARLGYSVPMSLFNFDLPKLVEEEEEEEEPADGEELDENDEEDDHEPPQKPIVVSNVVSSSDPRHTVTVVNVTSNAKGEATVIPTSSRVVALPSGTVVTKADTTVTSSEILPSSSSSTPSVSVAGIPVSSTTSAATIVAAKVSST